MKFGSLWNSLCRKLQILFFGLVILSSSILKAENLSSSIEALRNSLRLQIAPLQKATYGRTTLEADSCRWSLLELVGLDPISKESRRIKIDSFVPTSVERKSLPLIILPPTGGPTVLDHLLAQDVCRRGGKALLLSSFEHDEIEPFILESHDEQALRTLAVISQILDHLGEPGQIFGTSRGGLEASLALGFEPRLKQGIFIVAGADLPQILSLSEEPNVRSLRELRMRTWSLSENSEYLKKLRSSVHLSPETFIDETSRNKPTFMVMSTNDNEVPSHLQAELVKMWKPRELKTSGLPHAAAIIEASLRDQGAILKFIFSEEQ